MIATSKEIRAAIRDLWPSVGFLWLPDGAYYRPTIEEVITVLQPSGVASIEKRGEIWDCDDFALAANYYLKRWCLSTDAKNPWAFGEAFCSKLKGREMAHTLNILYASDGLWFIEPQGYHHWPADKEMDHVETVKM